MSLCNIVMNPSNCQALFVRTKWENVLFLSLQIYVEKPATSIHLGYGGNERESWGWAATTTTLDYDTGFSALPADNLMKPLHFTNGSTINISVTGFEITLKRKVSGEVYLDIIYCVR